MKTVLTLGLSLVLVSTGLAQKVDDDEPTTGKIVATSLSQIRRAADAYRHVWVRFKVQFVSMGTVKNPFFTRFVPAKYANFYAWAAEQKIWQKEEYETPFPLLFLSKRSPQLEELYRLKLYTNMEVIGIVRNVFSGEPWIEIKGFKQGSRKVTTGVLAHLYRGEQYMKKRDWQKAISELSLAYADEIPDYVMMATHQNLAVCHLRLGEAAIAAKHMRRAMALTEDPDAETRRLAQVAETNPELELDRTVTGAQIADHERPMWEAFEDQGMMQ
jgi:tetratricopeptide (TPR) repeat protein